MGKMLNFSCDKEIDRFGYSKARRLQSPSFPETDGREESAERIMRVADENNYRLNRAASLLNRDIALTVPNSENPFFSHILHALR